MKIGIEVQRLFRKRKFGIESSSLELIKKLKEIGPEHDFVIFAKNDEDVGCLPPSENLKIRTVAGKIFVDFEQFFLPLAAGKEHVDVLHCTGNTAPYFSPAPVVQTLHDVIFMDAIPAGDSLYQRFGNHYRRMVVPVVTPRSRAIVTVSEYEKDRIAQRLGLDRDRIQVIYNGINEARFHPHYDSTVKESVRAKYGLPQHFILFLGNQSFRKNSARAIEAYVRYASTTQEPLPLVTPGLPLPLVIEKLKALKFPYSEKQFFTPGYIADADLPVLYGLSTVFLFPSLSEGFGMPIVEAMACGAPVITSNISCMPEIAGTAGVLADPYSAEALAHALGNLSTDDAFRHDRIAAGLENAKRFSWNQAAQKMLGIYETVYQNARKDQKVPGFFHRYVFATRH